jgi:hypothetical protein
VRDRDFRVATAITCGVHPKLLDKWLRKGMEVDGIEPYVTFTKRFLQAEMKVRAQMLRELYQAKTKQKVSALTWMIERRFRQWRADFIPNDYDHEAVDVLASLGAKAGLTPDQKKFIITQMLQNPTGPILDLMKGAGWQQLPPGEDSHAQEAQAQAIATTH